MWKIQCVNASKGFVVVRKNYYVPSSTFFEQKMKIFFDKTEKSPPTDIIFNSDESKTDPVLSTTSMTTQNNQ